MRCSSTQLMWAPALLMKLSQERKMMVNIIVHEYNIPVWPETGF